MRKPSLASRAAVVALALASPSLVLAAPAAEGVRLPLDLAKSGPIKIDGVLKDWPSAFTPLGRAVSGAPKGPGDLEARAAIAYDDANVYVAMDITDDKLVRTAAYGPNEDHASLVLAFPEAGGGYQAIELLLFAGDPGNVAGAVRTARGAPVAGSTLVEAPRRGGYVFEAKIPWSAFAPAATVRVGLRGAIRVYDNDGSSARAAIGTATEGPPSTLPRALTTPEQAIDDAFAKEKGLTGEPDIDVIADVAGDSMRERVMLWGRYALVAGPHFRDGEQFFFNDLGVERSQVSEFDARDVTGDGKAELIVRKRLGDGARWREVMQVLGFVGEGMAVLFEHDVAAGTARGSIEDHVTVTPGAHGARIELRAGEPRGGLTAAGLGEPLHEGGVLAPWGGAKSETFTWDGTRFTMTKSSEPGHTSGTNAGPAEASAPLHEQPPPPRPPTADEKLDQLLALYKKDHKLSPSASPRFDLAANVAEDARAERVLAFGKDLVVFGKGFLDGTAYRSIALGFENARDVVDVTTFDVTNDGRAEILVRGVQRAVAPKELGPGSLEREVLLVYTVSGDKLARVFGAETALAVGDKRIDAEIAFTVEGAAGYAIHLRPGRAVGWSHTTWPYEQTNAPVGGLEPVPLPWAPGEARYTWHGTAFSK